MSTELDVEKALNLLLTDSTEISNNDLFAAIDSIKAILADETLRYGGKPVPQGVIELGLATIKRCSKRALACLEIRRAAGAPATAHDGAARLH